MFNFSSWNLGDWLTLIFAFAGIVGLEWQILRAEGMTYFKSLSFGIEPVSKEEAESLFHNLIQGDWFFRIEVEPGNPQPLYDARLVLEDSRTEPIGGTTIEYQPVLMLDPDRHLKGMYVAKQGAQPQFSVYWYLPSKIRRKPVLNGLRFRFDEKSLALEGPDHSPQQEELHLLKFPKVRTSLNKVLEHAHIKRKLPLYRWKPSDPTVGYQKF